MRLIVIISLLCINYVGLSQIVNQQSQYLFDGFSVNPAYAGSKGNTILNVGHTKRWTGLNGSPSNQYFGVHTLLNDKKTGLGFSANLDQHSVYKQTSIALTYAYHLKLSRKFKLALSLQPTYQKLIGNYDELILNDDLDPNFQNNVNTDGFNVGFGTYLYSEKVFAGISFPKALGSQNLISQNINFKNQEFIVYTGIVAEVNDDFRLKPSLLLRSSSFDQFNLDINLTAYYNKCNLGISVRTSKSATLFGGLTLARGLDFMMGYELSFNQMRNGNFGSYHLMLRYEISKRNNIRNPKYF